MKKISNLNKLKLLSLARPYYTLDRWKHIQDVLRIAKLIKKRRLNSVLNASIIWHDVAKRDLGALNHGLNGARIVLKLLATYYTPLQLHTIAKAIRLHNIDLRILSLKTFKQTIPYFSSPTSLLLAISDDDRPKDINKTWNKVFKYHIKGLPTDSTPLKIYSNMRVRLNPKNRMPELKYYKLLFDNRNRDFVKFVLSLTLLLVKDRVKKYKLGLK